MKKTGNIKYTVLVPDGAGSKGDEALIRGCLNVLNGDNITILNPRSALWSDKLLDRNLDFMEKYEPLETLSNAINDKTTLIVLGTDVIDGTQGLESSLRRLETVEKAIELGGKAYVFCSFRSDAPKDIINKIKSLNGKIRFYLRDYISIENFKNQIDDKVEYFPDFAFFCERQETIRTNSIEQLLDSKKVDGKTVIGLNFSEHSFISFYDDVNMENRKKYVSSVIDIINEHITNAYFVLISHDFRKWENHLSDDDFSNIALEYLKTKGFDNETLLIDSTILQPELQVILKKVDIVISGRMHLSVASFRNNVLPIVYTSYRKKAKFNMFEKVKGMFESRLGHAELVAKNEEEFINALEIVNNEKYKLLEKLYEFNDKNKDDDFNHMVMLRKEIGVNSIRNVDDEELRLRQMLIIAEKKLSTAIDNNTNLNNYLSSQKEKYEQEILNRDGHINLLLESERSLNRQIKAIKMEKEKQIKAIKMEKEKHILMLEKKHKDEITSIKEILNVKINNLNKELSNKEGHIELLLESDRELQRIKNSRSWRFMGYAWKLRDGMMPKGSSRRLLGKLAIKFIKHPIKFIKKLSLKRIRKFFYYLKREGVSNVSSRLDECVIGDNTIDIKLNLFEIIEKESYNISDFKNLVFSKVENPKVSIIIPVYNEIKYTYACLQSILKNSKEVEYEIIIANDCSTDLTSEINKFVENINVITTEENLRFLRNCNNAAQYAKGEYVLFLNNDTQVQENWLKPLVDLIEKDSSIGMVGSKLVYPDGRLQEAGGIIWNDSTGWNYGRLSNPQDPEFSYVKECDYISGAAIMIRHSLWKEIGGFDERYVPAYYEDSDLAFEVRRHGYKVMLQPLSIVVHFEGISNGTDVTSGQKAYQAKNCKTFKEKWKDELQKQFKNGENVFVARDRSKSKQHILVVDHYVPHYDKDAGSRTIYQYLNLFVKMGYSVSFIGDNFYRHEPYTTDLQQIGVEVLYGVYYSNNWRSWVKENSEYFDFVFLNRPHISEKYIDFLKENTKAKIVYYGHDLHFLREMREFELTGDNVILKSSEEWKKKELDLMNKADTILYPSDVEVSEIKKINNSFDVRRLPAYIMENSKKLKEINKRKDLLFVGGFGHGPNIDGIVWFCENIFPMIIEKNPKIKLNIVGSKAPDKVLALKSDNINVLGFVSDEKLAELYKDCRVSVAPLRYGAGIKGKIIEAIANGIPVVTTTCGAEGIANDNNFIIVEDDCEKFAQDILKLYDDEELIKSNIYKGFDFIENYYSSDSAEKFIRELFVK